jgi:hypothetical protein
MSVAEAEAPSPTRLFGTWAKDVPSEPGANARFRLRLLERAGQDPAFRRRLKIACREDALFYWNAFAWTYDPRTPRKALRFVAWPFQEKALLAILRAIECQHDLVIEKSRDLGASWMSLMAMEYLWHFHPYQSFLMVSRKEDLVDKPGDPDSLFWKLDFLLRHLPGWLKPRYDRKKLHFENQDNGSTIDGESTTTAASVGGRRTAIFLDEFSRMEEGRQILDGSADATGCRIFNFTVYGTHNAAYELARRRDVPKLVLHWSMHPARARGLYHYDRASKRLVADDPAYRFPADYPFVLDGTPKGGPYPGLRSPWYDAECNRRRNARAVAQMLDIDYDTSSQAFFDPHALHELQEAYCRPPEWEGEIVFDPDTADPVGLNKHDGGPLKLWITPDGRNKMPQSDYGCGVDCSTGVGTTNSVASFADARTGVKVAEYVSPYLHPGDFARRVVALCRLFRGEQTARVAWERQGPGVPFGNKVIQLRFSTFFFRKAEGRLNSVPTDLPGWVPTPENKQALLDDYRAALHSREFLNPSFLALEECRRFQHTEQGVDYVEDGEHLDRVSGKPDPSGARVNHGDRVIADALAYKMVRELNSRRPLAPAGQRPAPSSIASRRAAYEEGYHERGLLAPWEE